MNISWERIYKDDFTEKLGTVKEKITVTDLQS